VLATVYIGEAPRLAARPHVAPPPVARRLVGPLSAPRARRAVVLVVVVDQDRAVGTPTLRAERGVPGGALRVAGGLRTKACGAVHVGLRGVVHGRERVVVAHWGFYQPRFFSETRPEVFFHLLAASTMGRRSL
jgi:hypothetical protein